MFRSGRSCLLYKPKPCCGAWARRLESCLHTLLRVLLVWQANRWRILKKTPLRRGLREQHSEYCCDWALSVFCCLLRYGEPDVSQSVSQSVDQPTMLR
jgi:hypothetical protein